ncbi:MAG: ribonuclease HI [Rickettsiales bacterium]|jgi:ribonuclease HI|nr:ribonuclease HI [Rickettsiales bacterium]
MIKIYTDGSCLGNPGAGGWAFVATDGNNTAERSGGVADTTNNRMELLAVIRALRAAAKHNEIELFTDSQYVKNGMQSWVKNWKKNGWKTADKKPVKNKDLWEELDAAAEKIKIHWNWVRGHDGDPLNERCDELARVAAESIK